MDRYNGVKILKNKNQYVGTPNTQYYNGVTYPLIPNSETDLWIETEFGDRLDNLANQFYGDVNLYWIISIANPNKINMGSFTLPVGSQIRVPTKIVNIVDDYNVLNK